MITTTLNRIRAHSPCREGWAKLLRHLGKTEAVLRKTGYPQFIGRLVGGALPDGRVRCTYCSASGAEARGQ